MQLLFRAVDELVPGAKWRALFEATWPSYKAWFLSEGNRARPTYPASRRALEDHMPELVPTYERLVELAGGGDLAARFLSLYCPAPYLGGCSQVSWTQGEPALIRNYDYSAPLCDATVLRTAWTGRRAISMLDCAWGALDGVNDAGLAISLAFGGRKVVGAGFGIPLVLRYILETCTTTEEAARVLQRVPIHMSYNVTAIDANARAITAQVAPDRPALITPARVATNHQGRVEWEEHAAATATVEREQFLTGCLDRPAETLDALADRFLEPPIFLATYAKGWGTLYTALYRPRRGEAEYRWRGHRWHKSFQRFDEEERLIDYGVVSP